MGICKPAVALLAVTAIAGGCSSGSSDATGSTSGGSGTKLALVAYSTPQEAYGKLIPAFEKTAAGSGVTFSQSYGPSGDQSRAVDSGLPADVVEFSLESDMTRLVKDNLVAADWNAGQY